MAEQEKKVSKKLLIGIILMPYIFAWFLLKKGYSKKAKYLGFGWMVIALICSFGYHDKFATKITSVNIEEKTHQKTIDSTNGNIEYSAPLGMLWESSFKEVHKKLINKFNFQDSIYRKKESAFTATYKGEYLDFLNVKIETSFYHDSLFGITFQIPKQGDIAISKTWNDLIKTIRSKYNEPDTISPPPYSYTKTIDALKNYYPDSKSKEGIKEILNNMNNVLNNYQMLDYCIEEGSWEPSAVWKFKNAVIFCHIASPKNSDQTPEIYLGIFEKKLMNQWQKEFENTAKKSPKEI